MILTESQSKAINHRDSNLQLIACAGSAFLEPWIGKNYGNDPDFRIPVMVLGAKPGDG
jgi:hypothetical protein